MTVTIQTLISVIRDDLFSIPFPNRDNTINYNNHINKLTFANSLVNTNNNITLNYDTTTLGLDANNKYWRD